MALPLCRVQLNKPYRTIYMIHDSKPISIGSISKIRMMCKQKGAKKPPFVSVIDLGYLIQFWLSPSLDESDP